MNQLNNFADHKKENKLNLTNYNYKENKLNLINCKYKDTDYFKNLINDSKRKALSFFHMNVCSLPKNFDSFNILLSKLKVLIFLQLQNLKLRKIHQTKLIFN